MIHRKQITWAVQNPGKFLSKYSRIFVSIVKNPRSITKQESYISLRNILLVGREAFRAPANFLRTHGFRAFVRATLFFIAHPQKLSLELRRKARNLKRFSIDASKKPYEGVNLFGFYDYHFGLSRIIHFIERMLILLKLPHGVNSVPTSNHAATFFQSPKTTTYQPDYYVNIICVNPDECASFFDIYPYDLYFKGKYNIAHWVYEATILPESYFKYAPYFDEVWTPSTFSQSLLKQIGIPVSVVPVATQAYTTTDKTVIPAVDAFLKGKEKRRKFLFIFDYFSCPYRKNIFQLIDIFKEIYVKTNDFVLLIKIKNAPKNFVEDLMHRVAVMPVYFYEADISPSELAYLYDVTDYYLSLHASEGYGLTVLEAISYNRMPIVTNYGGVTDFCNADNSILIDYDLVPIPKESILYGQGKWAQPKKEQTVQTILSLIQQREIRRPSLAIFKQLNEVVVAEQILTLLKKISYKNKQQD